MPNHILETELETLIDKFGLYAVTQAMTDICFGKAEHLSSNWQDQDAAKRWTKAAKLFDRASDSLTKIQLP